MKTVGQTLKKHRLMMDLNLEEVAQKIKIKTFYLQAIERDDFSVFSSLAMAQGFIRNYGRVLGLDEKQLIALFKRDFGVSPTGKITWRKSSNQPFKIEEENKKWFLIPLVLVGGIILILVWWFRWFIFPPPLNIYQPKSASIVNQDHLVVKGRTLPGAEVRINNLSTTTDKQGRFSQPVFLLPGINQIEVKSIYKKKVRIKNLDVIYRPNHSKGEKK